jgi:cytochrome c553
VCGVLVLAPMRGLAEDAGDAPAEIWRLSVEAASEVVAHPERPAEGQRVYTVCAECHLASGAGDPGGTMPQLAGQLRSVLIKQMLDIRSGRRSNPLMAPYLEVLPDSQAIADVATHLSSLPVPKVVGRGPGDDTVRGARIYRERCASCHGSQGEGVAETFTPALRGQHYRYVVRQLIDIAGARRGNAHPGMVEAITDMSARDVAGVSDYVSRLPTASQRAGGNGR